MRGKKKSLIAVTLFWGITLFTVIVLAKQAQVPYTRTPATDEIRPLAAGTSAPSFDVENIDGKRVFLDRYRSKKPVLLFFWSFFCGPCREEIPVINRITKRYRKEDLAVLAINLDGKAMREVIRNLREREGLEYTIILDELREDTFRIAGSYGIAGVPSIYLVDKSGRIVFFSVGPLRYQELEAQIAMALEK